MAAVLIIVPGGEVRSTSLNDKGQSFVTIHTGKFRVVGEMGADGRFQITRDLLDEAFEIIEPEAEPAVTGG